MSYKYAHTSDYAQVLGIEAGSIAVQWAGPAFADPNKLNSGVRNTVTWLTRASVFLLWSTTCEAFLAVKFNAKCQQFNDNNNADSFQMKITDGPITQNTPYLTSTWSYVSDDTGKTDF
jgi:hypothetical protein